MLKIKLNLIYPILIFSFLIFSALAIPYYSGDVTNHRAWANSLIKNGPLDFYDNEIRGFYKPNYPPLTLSLFVLGETFYNTSKQVIWSLNTSISIFPSNLVSIFEWENIEFAFLKLPAILANIFLALGIYLISKKIWLTLAFLLNPATFHLSVIWGQIDFLPVTFLLFSFYFLFKSKSWLSAILFALALLSKQTIVIFLPVYLILMWQKYRQEAYKLVFLILAIFFLAFLPFHQFSLTWPVQFYLASFDSVALTVGENVFNLWGFLFDFKKGIPDSTLFFFFDYHAWGILLMLGFLILPTVKLLKNKITLERLFSYCFLVSLISFFFLTRLHERHLAPAMVFGTLLLTNKKYRIGFLFITTLFMLNLYNGSFMPRIGLFDLLVSSTIFLKSLVVIYFLMIIVHIKMFIWEK